MSPKSTSKGDVSYESTIRTLIHTERGAYADLSYLPVFRASGLFYVLVSHDQTTHVTFLNYWREKNGNAAVGALVSLRDADGVLVARIYFPVERMVYQIDARDLVDATERRGRSFEGTLEVELFSDKDLKFAFPALYVCYETPRGISYVHTNQRVYNSSEDQRRGDPFNPKQTGFDVTCADGRRPVVFLANGPLAVPQATAELTIYNDAGESLVRRVELGVLGPYASRRLEIAEIDGVRAFLAAGTGFVKLDLPLGAVFNRFACGIEVSDRSWLGITHSYFDCEHHGDYYDVARFSPDEYPCFVPVHLIDGIETDIVFYPILAPSQLSFRLACFDDSGAVRSEVNLPEILDGTGGRQVRLDLRAILARNGIEAKAGLYVIHVDSETGRLPTRISFGLNYRIGNLPGSNISSSVLMAPSYGVRPRAWLWGVAPCRPGARNVIMVSHISKVKGATGTAHYTLTLHGANGPICAHDYALPNGAGHNIIAETLLDEAGYVPSTREFVWYVVQSDCSSLICNQIHISEDGYIGGDHSF